MPTMSPILVRLTALLAIVVVVPAAHAQVPDVQGFVTIVEPDGVGGICNQPCYTVQKDFEVWLENNPGNPLPLAGNNTYLYKLTHLGGAGPIVPGITNVEMNIPLISQVTAVGYIATSPGIAPAVSAIDAAAVRWQWTTVIPNGGNSKQLYIHSPLLPGTATDNIVALYSQGNLYAPGTCVGPFVEPQEESEPMPCTIGFWKNRADGKQGTLQWFIDPQFDAVVTQAVLLCQPVFVDEADLLTQLASQGKRSILIRAKQKLAAFCLNLAAGDVDPDNPKCKLFEENYIGDNACGIAVLVGDALTSVLSDIQSGDLQLERDAQECSDDVNNGVSLFDGPPTP